MDVVQIGDGFHLDKHAVLDKRIGDKFSDDDTVVLYTRRVLLCDS